MNYSKSKLSIALLIISLFHVLAQNAESVPFFSTYEEFRDHFSSEEFKSADAISQEYIQYLTRFNHQQNDSEGQTLLSPEDRANNIKIYTNWWARLSKEFVDKGTFDIKEFVWTDVMNLNMRGNELKANGDFIAALEAYEHILEMTRGTYKEYSTHLIIADLQINALEDYFSAMDHLFAAKEALSAYKTNSVDNLIVHYTEVLARIALHSMRAGRGLVATRQAYEEYFDFGIDNDSIDYYISELPTFLKNYKSILKELKSSDQTYVNKVNAYITFLDEHRYESNDRGQNLVRLRPFEKVNEAQRRSMMNQLPAMDELKAIYRDNILNFIRQQ